MAKFPEPPSVAELRRRTPEIHSLPAASLLWRLYFRGGAHPTLWSRFRTFGPTRGRFDPHLPPPRIQLRAVLYCALHGPTTFAEVFQETRVIDRRRGEPWLVAFELSRAVQLLDLTGTFATRAGASMTIATGPRSRAQRWARAFHRAYPHIEGIVYASSMYANRDTFALWEDAQDALPPQPRFHRPLSDPALLTPLRHIAHELGYGLV